MLVPGDLGFRFAAVLIFVVFPVFCFVLRRKWRLEVARRAEIERLLVLAAEEADQAEVEATTSVDYFVAVSPPPVVALNQRICAVCYTPTPNRCARCKLVHYCSGKCQIIHWRQGHKDECFPSSTSTEIDDEPTTLVQNARKQPYSDVHGTHIKNDGPMYAEQLETSLEGRKISDSAFSSPDVSVKDDSTAADDYQHGKELGSKSVRHDRSVSFRLPTSIPSHDTCINESTSDDDSLHDLSFESCDSSSIFENSETAASDSHMEQVKSLEEKPASGHSNDEAFNGKTGSLGSRVSHSSKNSVEASINTSGFWDGTLDSSRTKKYVLGNNAKPKPVGADDEMLPDFMSSVQFSQELSGGHSPDKHSQVSETVSSNLGTAKTAKRVAEITSSNKDSAVDRTRQSRILLSSKGPYTKIEGVIETKIKAGEVGRKSATSKDISSSRANHLERNSQETRQTLLFKDTGFSLKSNEIPSSGLKGHTAPAAKPVKAVGDVVVPPRVARPIPSSSVGLKSSMLKVFDQLRAPRSANQADGAGRNGEKALFAYDLFVKLYHWNKVELQPYGLINCGNSCYANVVLQCLAFTPPLTAYILQGLHSKACVKKEWCFTCEFERLFLKANEVGYPQSPIGILSRIKKIGSHLTNGREEDAHEFLRYAIETMQSICLQEAEVKASSSLDDETTLVGLTFGGYLRSKIKCTRCHGKSERQERMMDLTVEIEGDIETLEDALRQFTGTESLDGENKYHCGRCKSYEKAKKKLNILEAPYVLTIALKRFQSGKFGKLNKSIRIPEILNLAPYMRGGSDKAPIYRLYGVVVHLDIMNASFSGHYVCYVRSAQNKWFKIDDSTVKPVELDRVLNKGAYMLFYSRCSLRAPRSIRSTIVSHDLPKNPTVDPSRSNGRISTSRQREMSAHANHIPDNLGNHRPIHIYGGDSSSDNSSLFSQSDTVSTSTDATRDSISADDISEYIFGNNAFYRSSDLDTSSSSSSSSSSPPYSTRSPLSNSERYASALPEHNVLMSDNGKEHRETSRAGESGSEGGVTFLHSNSSKQGRNLVNISSSEADSKRLGRSNPFDNSKSGVHLRRSSRKKSD
ncbi:hypothetical protein RND81_01G219200 [Saponaria officinalis]|uniref:ubiquitinyl hydrolase 1 n=1 Tax=Saponaria officinalis TaxID=3572 RepID=A0AAW1N910_SAPOF